jgi:hypothetical protein
MVFLTKKMKNLYLLIVLIVVAGCKKSVIEQNTLVGGCTDIDSPIYNSGVDFDDASCLYAYIYEYEISFYPSEDPSASWPILTWDDPISGANADLILKIWEKDNNNLIFTSSELPNQPYNTPGIWNAPENLKLYNKEYDWELVDYDGLNDNDFIASGTFNPIELAIEGEISTTGNHTAGNQSQLKIRYNLAP